MQSVAVPASVSLALAPAARSRSYGRRSYGRSKSYGRGRSYSRTSNYYRQRAGRRRAYIAGRYPKAQWAHPWVERGTQQAAALGVGEAGTTFAQATPSQQARRKQIGWYGSGDYMQPDSNPNNQIVPVMTGRALDGSAINLGKNKQMIRSEVFFNVLSPVASQQQIQSFEINIGLDEMFPLGSQFANNYKKYRITQLAFTYKNMLPQSQTTQQVGQVSLSFNPDVGEENEMTTNMQVANDQSTVTCNANEDVTLFCEMDPSRGAPNQFLNIRNKGLRVTQDPSDFDAGVFILTLAGFPVSGTLANYQIGRLSVSYCVELQHEVVNTSMGNSIDMDFFARPASTAVGNSSQFFDTDRLYSSENNVGCKLTNMTTVAANPSLSIQWPQTAFGYYQIEFYLESAPTVAPITPAVLNDAPNIILNSLPKTVGPVYDLVNTSSGINYTSAWSSQCLAPTGAAIGTSADPYVYGNGSQSWFPAPAAGIVGAGSTYRLQYVWHVYVPGVSSSATAPTPSPLPGATITASPIQLQLNIGTTAGYLAAVGDSSTVNTAKWTLRITEYNATMRLKLNGSSDQPYLTNVSGVPIILNATTWV